MKAFIGSIFTKFERVSLYFRREYIKSKFVRFGKNSYIGKNCIFTPGNIEIGEDTYVGPNCIFQSSFGSIRIGNHVMFGPGVNIHGGNHKFNEVGRYMKDASPKTSGDDGLIVIEDDCWIGANAMILSNVTIGKGLVIGAGSIVTKDIPPYSIYTGVPEKRIRNRFSPDDLSIHIIKMRERGDIYD